MGSRNGHALNRITDLYIIVWPPLPRASGKVTQSTLDELEHLLVGETFVTDVLHRRFLHCPVNL